MTTIPNAASEGTCTSTSTNRFLFPYPVSLTYDANLVTVLIVAPQIVPPQELCDEREVSVGILITSKTLTLLTFTI